MYHVGLALWLVISTEHDLMEYKTTNPASSYTHCLEVGKRTLPTCLLFDTHLVSVPHKKLLLSIIRLHCNDHSMTRVDDEWTSYIPRYLHTQNTHRITRIIHQIMGTVIVIIQIQEEASTLRHGFSHENAIHVSHNLNRLRSTRRQEVQELHPIDK